MKSSDKLKNKLFFLQMTYGHQTFQEADLREASPVMKSHNPDHVIIRVMCQIDNLIFFCTKSIPPELAELWLMVTGSSS